MRHWFCNALVASLSFTLAGCLGFDSGGESSELTYYKDVKPIIDAKCVQCHYEGSVAPFSLETFEDVQTHAGVSKLAVEAGTMPPWHPSEGCGDYEGDRSLSDKHKQMLLDWLGSDLAVGDPADVGEPIPVEDTTIGRVDLEIAMPEAYTAQRSADYTDDYRCFAIPWPEQTVKYVTGFNAVPGADAVVHHMIAFLATPDQADHYITLDANDPAPGYDCFGGTNGPASTWVGSWAPGGQGSGLPDGVGFEIQPGSLIVLQMHYNTLAVASGEVPADQSAIQFQLEDQVDKVGFLMPFANPQWLSGTSMHIPPNDTDVMHSFSLDPTLYFQVVFGIQTDAVQFYGGGLHMHLLGKSGLLEIRRADGVDDCLLDIGEYDFDWQDGYRLRQPKLAQRGDNIYLECHWDNSAENQPMIDGEQMPPTDVYWGEGSTDEMCLGVLLAVPEM